MNNINLLINLLALQTSSRFRGIGRYVYELTLAMIHLKGNNDVFCMADPLYSESYEDLRQDFIRRLPIGQFLPYYHEPVSKDIFSGNELQIIASCLISHAYKTLNPDVVLTGSVFEGLGNSQFIVPLPQKDHKTYQNVAIIYDFIPYIFKENYFGRNFEFKQSYLSKIEQLKDYDLLLSISEATRQDAIKLFEISPKKIVNISAAASNFFHKIKISSIVKDEFLHKMGIVRPFIFYLGGNEFRKNMVGALEAYANLPKEILQMHQLVVNDPGDIEDYRKKASDLGLEEPDLIIISKMTDEELRILYNLCKIFIFPSLYEGFGLPVLEAMACGAPTLATNNSSLSEIILRKDALFKSAQPNDITNTLLRALTNSNFRAELSQYGLKRSKQFSWEITAKKAWDAIETLTNKSKKTFSTSVRKNLNNKPRIAYLSPLPPQRSGIADYSAELLGYLKKYFQIDLFIDSSLSKKVSPILNDFSFYPWQQLLALRNRYKTAVYQQGNSAFHTHMFDLEREFPGVIVLHDFFLSHIRYEITFPEGKFLNELGYSHGIRSILDYQKEGQKAIWDWPTNWKIFTDANEIIVHSKFHKQLQEKYYKYDWKPNLNLVPQLRSLSDIPNNQMKKDYRHDLGIRQDDFVFASFGSLSTTKHNDLIISAFAKAEKWFTQNSRLFFVGEFINRNFEEQIKNQIKELNLQNKINITGFLGSEDYDKYLSISDAAIQLRKKSRGETSRAVLDGLSYGLPVILNDNGTNKDYSKGVVKISDPVLIDDLMDSMIKVQNNETFRANKGKMAREYLSKNHNPESVAEKYAQIINRAIHKDDRKHFKQIFPILNSPNSTNLMIEKQVAYAINNFSSRSHHKILIQIGPEMLNSKDRGINFIVNNLLRKLLHPNIKSPIIEAVYLKDGNLFRSCRYLEGLFGLSSNSLGKEKILEITPGDTLILTGGSNINIQNFNEVFDSIRINGGKIITFVYDIVPLIMSDYLHETEVSEFKQWFNQIIGESDLLVSFSQSISEEIAHFISSNNLHQGRKLDITYLQLGKKETELKSKNELQLNRIDKFNLNSKPNVFIVIGNIEYFNHQEFILDTFDQIWGEGEKSILVVAGKVGLNASGIEKRFRNHNLLNKNFFFITNPTEEELNSLYSSATSLILASDANINTIEISYANAYNLPLILLDTPLYHELAYDESTTFFSIDNQIELKKAVKYLEIQKKQIHGSNNRNSLPNWENTSQYLIDLAMNKIPKNISPVLKSNNIIEPINKNKKTKHKTINDNLLSSCACSQELLQSEKFQFWIHQIKEQNSRMHRKLWEWSFISQALFERGLLNPGIKGLGFAVGQEPLSALFAFYGCKILATDLNVNNKNVEGWARTNQHAAGLKDLNKLKICPNEIFNRRVSFRFVNMNNIDKDLRGFDFVWSSCSLEHLGSLEKGKEFIYNSLNCLKPGGFAIHTTEFNVSSNTDTLVNGESVIYRKKDIREIAINLRSAGHKIKLDFNFGTKPYDLHVDYPPYSQDIHLRLNLLGFVSTSYGLIIQKAK